jgi:hypothetical protein
MGKKLIAIICSFGLIAFNPSPANASSDSIRYKSTEIQAIPKNKWTTLKFNGGKTEIQGNGKRSLFCYQAVIDTKGKKSPSYIKLRITRIVPGPNDPSATNTYFFTDKPGSKFVASNCWNIVTKHPVVVQIRITGGSKTYNSDIRQFKMWTPNGEYPEDFSDFIPETAID